MKNTRKAIAMIALVAVIVCATVAGTVAFLKDTSETVTNTFTPSDINITLEESDDLDLQMVPGCDITKDPVVTVEANSEDCYVFVVIEKSDNYSDYLEDYTVASGWTKLEDGVYYQTVSKSTVAEKLPVLKDDKVTVKDTVTKEMMEDIADGKVDAPTLTFTAYAIQQAGFDTAADAWAELNPAEPEEPINLE